MLGRLQNDALKISWVDVTIAILIKQLEGLTNALALKTTKHLGELGVGHVMALLLASNVELGPLTLPVEGDACRALVEFVEAAEVGILDGADAVDVEKPESDLVLGIGLLE